MSKYITPNLQKEKIEGYLAETGKRLDGRKSDEYREISITDGISKNSASAIRVKVGKTEVLAGVQTLAGRDAGAALRVVRFAAE